jgi:hypothetical protein
MVIAFEKPPSSNHRDVHELCAGSGEGHAIATRQIGIFDKSFDVG